MSNEKREPSATNAALGSLVSWVAGKDSTKRGSSPLDGAVGELLSWFTGKGGRREKGTRPRG